MDGAENQKWMELLRDYMIDNHINHTFWCLNTNSGDTGGLWAGFQYSINTGSKITWEEDKYALFEKSLWQTLETGKYIGLDHQKALGNNGTGLSLSEFYESYASTEGSNLDGGTIVNSGTVKPTATTATAKPTETTSTTTVTSSDSDIVYGDANLDGSVDIADAVAIASYVGDSKKNALKAQGLINADVHGDKNGVNANDALAIQQYLAGIITAIPVK